MLCHDLARECFAGGGALSSVTAGVEAEGAAGIGAVKRAVPQAEYVQIKVAAAALAARALWFAPPREAHADGVDLEPCNPQLGAASQGALEGASVSGSPAHGEARPAATPLVRHQHGPKVLRITVQICLAATRAARRRKPDMTGGRSAAHATGEHRHCHEPHRARIARLKRSAPGLCRRQRTQMRGSPRPAPPSALVPHARPARRPRLAPPLAARRWAWRAQSQRWRDCQGRA